MDLKTTSWFYKKIWCDNLCLLYNGSFGDDITDKVIELSEYNVDNKEEYSKMTNKLSSIVAECFQNIIRHSDSKETEEEKRKNEGFFLSKNKFGSHYIASGNLIENEDVDNLQSHLNKINQLNKEGLKEMYRKLLDNQEFSKKTIMGLGLIDMARKSGQKLERNGSIRKKLIP